MLPVKPRLLPAIFYQDSIAQSGGLQARLSRPGTRQEMLGHSRITTTIHMYSHVSLDLEKRATQALNDLLKQKSPSAKDGLE